MKRNTIQIGKSARNDLKDDIAKDLGVRRSREDPMQDQVPVSKLYIEECESDSYDCSSDSDDCDDYHDSSIDFDSSNVSSFVYTIVHNVLDVNENVNDYEIDRYYFHYHYDHRHLMMEHDHHNHP